MNRAKVSYQANQIQVAIEDYTKAKTLLKDKNNRIIKNKIISKKHLQDLLYEVHLYRGKCYRDLDPHIEEEED